MLKIKAQLQQESTKAVEARGIPVPAPEPSAPAKRREYKMTTPNAMLDFIKRGDKAKK